MDQTDTFLHNYPEQEVEQEVARLEALKEELALVRRLKALRAGLGPATTETAQPVTAVGGVPSEEAVGAPTISNGSASPATRRRAIETVLENDPNRGMKLSDLRDALAGRGWLGQSEEDYHRLQVTASRMFKRGQLERPEQGYYRLPGSPRRQERGTVR